LTGLGPRRLCGLLPIESPSYRFQLLRSGWKYDVVSAEQLLEHVASGNYPVEQGDPPNHGRSRRDCINQLGLALVTSPLPRSLFREELLAIRKAVGLEEEADDDGAVGRHRLVPIAGRPPDKLTRSAYALVILDRALEHISLFRAVCSCSGTTAPGASLNRAVVMPLSSE
jgi:hypothetical protein